MQCRNPKTGGHSFDKSRGGDSVSPASATLETRNKDARRPSMQRMILSQLTASMSHGRQPPLAHECGPAEPAASRWLNALVGPEHHPSLHSACAATRTSSRDGKPSTKARSFCQARPRQQTGARSTTTITPREPARRVSLNCIHMNCSRPMLFQTCAG